MNNNNSEVTYETLFEVLRNEKNKIELQKLDKSFYEQVAIYIKQKLNSVKKDQNKGMGSTLILKELDNIKKIVNDIYFRRIKKIQYMVHNVVMNSDTIIEKDALLAQEKEFFDSLRKNMTKNRKNILEKILVGQSNAFASKDAPVESDESEDESEIEPKQEQTEGDFVSVKFNEEVPKFVGSDLKYYGPFQPEDIASIPSEIGKILVTKGQAIMNQ